MEDAEILSRFLLTTNLGVEYALKRYEAERKERTSTLVLKARKRADMIYGKDPDLTQQWYQQLQQETEQDVTNALSKTILGGRLTKLNITHPITHYPLPIIYGW